VRKEEVLALAAKIGIVADDSEILEFAAAIREWCALQCMEEGAYAEEIEMAYGCAARIRGYKPHAE
jgi:hypothetical protein